MNFNDYIQQVTADALDAIGRGDYDHLTYADEVVDEMWTDDSVTGNGSGSYTFSTWQAQQNVAEVIWDETFLDELREMCIDLGRLMEDGPEAVDVTARCLALAYAAQAIEDAWDERREGLDSDAA